MATVELWMLFFFFGYFPNPIYLPFVFQAAAAAAFIHKLSSYGIHMFLGLLDPHTDMLVTNTDLALDPATAAHPSIIKKNSKS
jgi:hypothetical protein